jgi:hypothetical protein
VNLIELTLVTGGGIDIPPTAITFVEGLEAVKNSHHPEAQSFIRYSIGDTDRTALLLENFETIRTVTMVGGAPDWCEAIRDTGNPIRFRATHVEMRESVTSETARSSVTLMLDRNGTRAAFDITQTIEEVRAMMRPPAPNAPPPGVVVLPEPEPTPNRRKRRATTKEN